MVRSGDGQHPQFSCQPRRNLGFQSHGELRQRRFGHFGLAHRHVDRLPRSYTDARTAYPYAYAYGPGPHGVTRQPVPRSAGDAYGAVDVYPGRNLLPVAELVGKRMDGPGKRVHVERPGLSSPNSVGVLAYRVVVTYGTGAEATTATSSAVVAEWKPVVINLTSSPEFPLSGQADKRTVTLTAGGDVPSGATYQWQEWSGTAWNNLGTASTAATKTVSSTSRGAKKYQVIVSHTSASSVTSEPIHVTWDE